MEAMRMRLGDHTDKRKILERVIVSAVPPVQRHHWGEVRPGRGAVQSATCLAKDRFRVRIEGWRDDVIIPREGWTRVPMSDCEARKQIAVWSPSGVAPRSTEYGAVPGGSGYEDSYWIEYLGPLTGGIIRVAGPFG